MTATKRSMLSWALYDWANSAFATTVLAGFFPAFFRQYWNHGATDTTLKLGATHAVVGVLVAILAPTLGAIADRRARRRLGIFVFAALGISCTGLMFLPGPGMWFLGAALFVGGMVGFACGNAFYDALLGDVAPPGKQDSVSALGYGLGYLGGGVLFAGNLLLYRYGDRIGITDPAVSVKISFVSVAIWWGLFSIPLFLFVKERPATVTPEPGRAIRNGLRQLRQTVAQIRRNRNLLLFILAYFCYIDGVNTVIKMAVDYSLAIEIVTVGDAMLALLLVQLIAFPAAIIYGKLGERIGARIGILIGVIAYGVLTVWSVFMQSRIEFFGLAVCVALIQGGVQALSRSLYSSMIPPERSAEYFGIYNVLGKFESVLGPLLVGLTAYFGSKRLGMVSLLPLFVIGAVLLWLVKPSGAPGAGQPAER